MTEKTATNKPNGTRELITVFVFTAIFATFILNQLVATLGKPAAPSEFKSLMEMMPYIVGPLTAVSATMITKAIYRKKPMPT